MIQVQNSLCLVLLASSHTARSPNLTTFSHLFTPSSSNLLFIKILRTTLNLIEF